MNGDDLYQLTYSCTLFYYRVSTRSTSSQPAMKRGRTLSDWMSSALNKKQKHQEATNQLSDGPPPVTTSHSHPPPPTASQKPRKAVRRIKSNENISSGSSHSSSKSSVTPLTAGTLPGDDEAPWVIKHKPKTAADLAVHKKKVGEVQQWLEFALSAHARHPILLLSGPPGCGKTATVHALAHDLGFSILEWVNPSSEGASSAWNEGPARSGDLVLYPESQTKQFQDFLTRANRYPSLMMGGASGGGPSNKRSKKIVLVEEFPNAFLRDPSKFHQVMGCVSNKLIYPLVFIVSDSHRGGSSSTNLFNRTALNTMDVHTISFNPVAHTSLVKTMQRIASIECQKKLPSSAGNKSGGNKRPTLKGPEELKFHMPPKEVFECLAESSAGDIRSAVNALQFACLKDSSDLLHLPSNGNETAAMTSSRKRSRVTSSKSSGSSGKSRKGSVTSEVASDWTSIGGRDSSLFLFRALGKILYCKRDTECGITEPLPPHLQQHERPPLMVNPESVVEHTQMSSEMFTLYLHQNYMEFFDDMDDVGEAVGYLSDSDIIGHLWTDAQDVRASLQAYSSSISCRGLMHTNRSTAGGRWRPLHKPQWKAVHKQYHDNCQAARSLFLHLGSSPYAHLWTPVELQTEILPYLAVVNAPLRNPAQVSLLTTISYFKCGGQRIRPETLGERDTDTPSTLDADSSEFTQMSLAHARSISVAAAVNQPTQPSHGSGGDGLSQGSMASCSSTSASLSQQTLSQDVRMGDVGESEDEIEDFDDDVIW